MSSLINHEIFVNHCKVQLSHDSEQKWEPISDLTTEGSLLYFTVTDKNDDVWKGYISNSGIHNLKNKKLQTFLIACPEEIVKNFNLGHVEFEASELRIAIMYIKQTLVICLTKQDEDPKDREIRLLKRRIVELEKHVFNGENRDASKIINNKDEIKKLKESIETMAIIPFESIAISRAAFDAKIPVNELLIDFASSNDYEYKEWIKKRHNTTHDVMFKEYYSTDEKLLHLRIGYAADKLKWELIQVQYTPGPIVTFMFFRTREDAECTKIIKWEQLQNEYIYMKNTLNCQIVQMESTFLLIQPL